MLKLQFSPQQLCLDLLHADTEEQVISLLRSQGHWDNPDAWRSFGDKEGNYSTFGNQARSADASLVEKIVNSVDAVLIGECRSAGIKPNSPEAPRSIPEAVAQFFRGDRTRSDSLGHIGNWSQEQRRSVSKLITLAATGTLDKPSVTIVDAGEGQSPNSMPKTLLSLDTNNKVDIHFVQGTFNMGGTGALRFCGRHNLQLVISRRNPKIKFEASSDSSHNQWGFTIVRRDNPTDSKKMSTYTYLAPEPDGGILRFDSDALPLYPDGHQAYMRSANWGTAIKLYEYKLDGRSNILRRKGLLSRLDILLPGVALPVRLHECRDHYGGGKGSFATTLTGLRVRLGDDRGNNLEQGFPTSSAFTIRGQEMTAEIYAFIRGRAETYKKSEGVLFTVNGQTQGDLHKRFFSRKAVGMNSLEDSILVLVDCSRLGGRAREDLFMNSRDRMEQGEFLRAIEEELASILKDNQPLKDLRERRRREDSESKLQDSKPFKEVLESILRRHPSLAQYLGQMGPLSDPFRSKQVKSSDVFEGCPHPSYFKFKDMDYGRELQRRTAINMRSRIVFETDVANDYFTRSQFFGKYELRSRDGSLLNAGVPDRTLNLHNGVATLNLTMPATANIGDTFSYELIVDDETLAEPFVNPFVVSVGPAQEPSGGNGSRRRSPKEGTGTGEASQGLAIPIPIPVYESNWGDHQFDRESALRAVYYPSEQEGSVGSHTYYINMDNVHLKTELKATKENPEVVKRRWQYGMVLIGMALLRDNSGSDFANGTDHQSKGDDAMTPEDAVLKTTRSVAPVLLPLIEHLGALSVEDVGSDS